MCDALHAYYDARIDDFPSLGYCTFCAIVHFDVFMCFTFNLCFKTFIRQNHLHGLYHRKYLINVQ